MPVQIYISEDTVTACLSGELDHHSAKAIREEIDETIERVKPSELIIDFRNLTFMDSSGIGLVMGRYQLMQEFDGVVKIINLANHIKKVMKLAGLDKLASIEEKEGEKNEANK